MQKLSGNLMTNEYMPAELKNKLLKEDASCEKKISFEDVYFPNLKGFPGEIGGLNILSGLQKISKKDCLTVFRAIRFPTHKRIFEMLSKLGCTVPNYEQERILKLYKNKGYISERDKIQNNRNFQTQPQERVVRGLPVFSLINDALQIHRAWRDSKDRVAMVAIHIPYKLLRKGELKIYANTAIDLDHDNAQYDFEIKDFVRKNGVWDFDFKSLQTRGIDLHEMYLKNLPWTLGECGELGIKQEFFLLYIYEIRDRNKIGKLFKNTKILKENRYFLHGFFGDQNVFGRRPSKFLPYKCRKVALRNNSK